MVNPWLYELEQAVPALAVVPKLRVLVIHHLLQKWSAADAVALEAVALHATIGKLKLYMTFVQYLLATPKVLTVEDFALHCHSADRTQTLLSDINIQRDNLLQRLHEQKFSCPEVPEASNSQRACPQCGCTDLLGITKQTRSADGRYFSFLYSLFLLFLTLFPVVLQRARRSSIHAQTKSAGKLSNKKFFWTISQKTNFLHTLTSSRKT